MRSGAEVVETLEQTPDSNPRMQCSYTTQSLGVRDGEIDGGICMKGDVFEQSVQRRR